MFVNVQDYHAEAARPGIRRQFRAGDLHPGRGAVGLRQRPHRPPGADGIGVETSTTSTRQSRSPEADTGRASTVTKTSARQTSR